MKRPKKALFEDSNNCFVSRCEMFSFFKPKRKIYSDDVKLGVKNKKDSSSSLFSIFIVKGGVLDSDFARPDKNLDRFKVNR